MTYQASKAGLLVALATLLAVMQPSCSDPYEYCYDCGPCGFAGGPNAEDGIRALPGADPDGTPTVELGLFKAGQCGVAYAFWLRFKDAAASVDPAPLGAQLDYVAATLGPTGTGSTTTTYEFKNAGITVAIQGIEDSLKISFHEGASTVMVTCTVVGEDSIECVP